MGGDLGVKGVKGSFEVLGELVKGFLSIGDGGIGHSIIPGFSVGSSSSIAHLVQRGHDLGGVRGVQGVVQHEVGLHGLDPSGGIIVLAREVSRESHLQLRGVHRHGWGYSGCGRC